MKYSFEMALVYLKQGKKIRRASWADSKRHLYFCPEMDPNDIVEVDEYWTNGAFTRCLECCDILASDWEVIE
jgi:hypothetical protein